jgi:hypothetical protein
MKRRTDRSHRLIAGVFIALFVIGGVPRLASVVIEDADFTFTLDICHPLDGAGTAAGAPLMAPPAASSDGRPDAGAERNPAPFLGHRIVSLSISPDTPPPRASVL